MIKINVLVENKSWKKYIKNPELDSENRRKIVNNEIGAFKGNATKNISDIINKILNK